MIKSGYLESIYYRDGLIHKTSELEDSIRKLLTENHGVGILGGTYDDGFPLCMVSELTVQMLGYVSDKDFEEATGGKMSALIKGHLSAADFEDLDGDCEVSLYSKSGELWVRLVKRDFDIDGEKMWIASVCDTDALYKKSQQEIADKKEIEKAYETLSERTEELEQALYEAQINNEIISAISKTYWLIYRINLQSGVFEEVSTNGEVHKFTGDRGFVSERFPSACKNMISDEFQEELQAFLNIETLPERLAERDEVSCEYQTRRGNWHVGRFIVQQRDENGHATKVLYAIQGINERKKQELEYEEKIKRLAEEARLANLSKTEFLRRMSHDIRTPINGIRGMIKIANRYNDPQKQLECRQKIWEASGYLLSLVNNVLDMNKLESGKIVLDRKPFDLEMLLEELDTVAEMQAIDRGVKYTVAKEKKKIENKYFIGSPSYLKQILMNIAGNAIKYNKYGGTVTVWTEETFSTDKISNVRFVCEDTGIGMSEEFQKHAFEPFSQEGKETARTNYAGTGLGLPIVKSLVEVMGGTLEFTSEENVGTKFSVTLPLEKSEIALEAPENEETADLHGKKVLVVEDNRINLEITEFLLGECRAEVVSAKNGKEAVEIFEKSADFEFSAVLMDVMMPVMNGLDATKAIRKLPRADAETVPIIAMSANAFTDDVERSLKAGMDEHLIKPLDEKLLMKTLNKYINK